MTSNAKDIPAWDEIEAAQYDDTGTKFVPLPTKLITMYISKYQTMATIKPNKALVKKTLKINRL